MRGKFGEQKYLHYYPIYDRYFAPFYGRPCTVLEIGIADGGSLALWRHLFGPQARIAGLDRNPACPRDALEALGFPVFLGFQESPSDLAKVYDSLGSLDVVIDDGSHVDAHIKASFDFLYPRLSPKGVYLIEDIHDPRRYPFATWTMERIPELSASFHDGDQTFEKTTQAIHFHNSVIVYERA